jgi:hypothetical protein
MATIYRKTADGHAEVETRARGLVPRLRTALIMVDGKRNDEELRKLIGPQADETLQILVEQGMIEAISITVPKPVPRQSTAASASAPAAKDFATLRREAVRAVNDTLGPVGESLAIKMEQAKSAPELQKLLERAITVIGNARGGAAAAQFARQFMSTTP